MAVQYISLAQQGFGSGADDIQQAAQQALINRQLREKMAEERKTAPARAELLKQQAAWYGDRTQSAEAIAKMRVESAQQLARSKAEDAATAAEVEAKHKSDLQAQADAAARLRGQDKTEAEKALAEKDRALKALHEETTRKLAEAKIEAERAKAAIDLATKIPTIKVGGQAFPATRDAEGNVSLDTEGVDAVTARQAERDQQAAMDAALAQRFVKGDNTGAPSKGFFRRALSGLGIDTDPEIMQAAPEDKAAFGALLGNRQRAIAAGVNPDAFAPYASALGAKPAGIPVHQGFQQDQTPTLPPVGPTSAQMGSSAAPNNQFGATTPPVAAPAPAAVSDTTAQSPTSPTKFSALPVGAEFMTKDGKRWRKTGPAKTDRELVSEAPSGQ